MMPALMLATLALLCWHGFHYAGVFLAMAMGVGL